MTKLDEVTKLVRIRLLGESLREFGVLTLIFPVLDILLESKGQFDWAEFCLWQYCLSGRYIALVFFLILGIFALYYGIKIESAAEVALKALKAAEEKKEGGQDAISDASN